MIGVLDIPGIVDCCNSLIFVDYHAIYCDMCVSVFRAMSELCAILDEMSVLVSHLGRYALLQVLLCIVVRSEQNNGMTTIVTIYTTWCSLLYYSHV